MFRLTLRGIRARRLRVFLIGFAVFLGVSMISGTFVLTDTIDAAFNQIFTAQTKGADALVTARQADDSQFTEPKPFSANILKRVSALPEVANAGGQITDRAAVIGKDGKILITGGAPTIAASFAPAGFTATKVVKGRAPTAPNELALDKGTADREGFKIGDTVKVATTKPVKKFKLVGLISIGEGVSLGSTTFVVFDFKAAEDLFDKRGRLDLIYAAARSGVSPKELAAAIRPLLPAGVQVRTAAEQVESELDDIGRALTFITTGLLAFAFVAILVGAFTIFNTFSITVVQRTRELGLLRTIGATRRQLLFSILLEALLIGVVGSLLGVLGGFVFAQGVDQLFRAFGAILPSTDQVFASRTIIVGLVCGITVTLAAAIVPAIRATRVTPIEALQLGQSGGSPSRSRRRLTGFLTVLLILLGAAMVTFGLLSKGGDSTAKLSSAAGGAVVLILGVSFLTPRFVRPIARLIGLPLERFTRVSGRLARENTARIPGRTAITSATLMIGLAVMLFVTIFANGVRESVASVIEQRFAGDIAILNVNGFSPFPARTATAIKDVPGIKQVSVFRTGETKVVGDGSAFALGVDPNTLLDVYRFEWIDGRNEIIGGLGDNQTVVEEGLADRAHLKIGSNFSVILPSKVRARFTVKGIYKDKGLLNGYVINQTTFRRLFGEQQAILVLANLTAGADQADVLQAVGKAIKPFPQARARSQQQLQDDRANQVNQILGLFYALLALSVIISIFGIVNTLTLSIHERTREIGLLRAVGMTRREVRRMIRYESVITAAIGGMLGLVLGLFFALIVTEALSGQGIVFSIPIGQVLALLIFALLVGVVAAIGPARRASRLDILDALARE